MRPDIAADTARFGQPEVKVSILPDAGGTQRPTRAVGKGMVIDTIERSLKPVVAWLHGTLAICPSHRLNSGVEYHLGDSVTSFHG